MIRIDKICCWTAILLYNNCDFVQRERQRYGESVKKETKIYYLNEK